MRLSRFNTILQRVAFSQPNPPGFSLLSILASLVILSSLATAIATLTPSATLTSLANGNTLRAHYLALSGLNLWSVGKTGVYTLDGDTFTLSQTGPDALGYYTVTSLGRANANTGSEANVLLTARRQASAPISFTNDIADFLTPTVGATANNATAIVVYSADRPDAPAGIGATEWATMWSENVNRYAGGWMRFGNATCDTDGAIWYLGKGGTCAGGRCALGKGLRASFCFAFSGYDTTFDSKGYGNGFTFAVITAENDPQTAAGGLTSPYRGEFLGYAGPGPSGQGIKAPKLAVEVDVLPNRGTFAPTVANSRADKSNANHVAVVYWGTAATTYDDNVHAAGASPQNPGGASAGYYEKAKEDGLPNWLEDGEEHCLRLEIHRETADATGAYAVMVWVDPTGAGRADVTADYTAQTPQLSHRMTLSAADHAKLDNVYFGWTEAMSGGKQTLALHDFFLEFRR
jgi:hypothetical protein